MQIPGKWIPDNPPPVPITTMVAMHGRDDERVKSFLGPEGLLSTGGSFKYRPAQHQLSQFALRALEQRKHLLAEAGTGTGKSFGLLVPLIEYAMRTGTVAVVSTAQNVLLDQYKNKDLPFLKDALKESMIEKYGRNFKWATMKGRSNYYCPMSRHEEDLSQYSTELDQVWEWLEDTKTGDLAELPYDVNRYLPLKQSLISETDDCPGSKKCDSGDHCWYYRAKEYAAEADILIVNHALLACDLVSGGQILPTWDGFAIDEGHQFGKYMQSAMETIIRQRRWQRLFRKLEMHSEDPGTLRALVSVWNQCLESVAINLEKNGKLDLRGQRIPPEFWSTNDNIQRELHSFATNLEMMQAPTALPLSRSISELKLSLSFLDFNSPKSASWIEKDKYGHISLHVVPIDCSEFLEENLWRKHPGIIASATLATSADQGKEFEYCKEDLGVPGHPYELVLPSPFDWPKQALYLFPSRGFLVDGDFKPNRGESYKDCVFRWVDKAWPMVKRAMERTKGRAFVLCTSKMACEAFAERHLVDRMPFPQKVQGEASKQALIDWFKSTPNPVLYATSSFWEGVDIPGDQLQLVVIDKIPFPNTSDPLEKARCDRLGRESFDRYQIPLAITHLKQGVGRLIRTETDKGVLLLLDPRFRDKGYGKKIAAALPGESLHAMYRRSTNIRAFLAGYSAECVDSEARSPVTPDGIWPNEIRVRLEDTWKIQSSSIDLQIVGGLIRQLEECGGLTLEQWQMADEITAPVVPF